MSRSRASFGLLDAADDLDHQVQMVERLLESEQDVLALARLAQSGIRCAGGPRPRGGR